MYDLIGDIHGHAYALIQLLEKLGYYLHGSHYKHPERKVIFVGDFIDRGKQIRKTLKIVKSMVDNKTALAVMGNHEYNAIMFHTPDPQNPESYLRKHNKKNIEQHSSTLEQLSSSEIDEYIEWFKTLPIWLNLDGVRVVHACWEKKSIDIINKYLKIFKESDKFWIETSANDELYHAVDRTLKGKEILLPENIYFVDQDGNKRRKVRVKWFISLFNKTYADAAFPYRKIIPDIPIPHEIIKDSQPYPANDKPIFFGHYWLSEKEPSKLTDNVTCLDYSIANNGFLCAYRWNGEKKLNNKHFVMQQGPAKNTNGS
jgi:hypothetical protein